MRRHGVPDAVLTDNGKVFTGRFGPGHRGGAVRSDLPGERHQASPDRAPVADDDGEGGAVPPDAAPASSSPAGLRVDRRRAGAARCVGRALQPCAPAPGHRDGRADRTVPSRRGRADVDRARALRRTRPPAEVARRRVDGDGRVSFASTPYMAGKWLAGETVEVTCDAGVMTIAHRGVVVATHARRHRARQASRRDRDEASERPAGRPAAGRPRRRCR